MALVFCEGFDKYGSVANMTRSRWFGANVTDFPSGRFSGKCLRCEDISCSLGADYGYGVLGYAFMETTGSENYHTTYLSLTKGSTRCVLFTLDAQTGLITLALGLPAYPSWTDPVASSYNGAIALNTWYYVEIKIDKEMGVELRLNGETKLSWEGELTGVPSEGEFDTLNWSTNTISTYRNRVHLDDMYFLDARIGKGSRPMNDFIGDKRVAAISPASNDSVQWTPVAEVTYVDASSWTHETTVAANKVYLPNYIGDSIDTGTGITRRLDEHAIEAVQDSTLKSITLYGTTTTPGVHIRPVLYAEDPLNPNKPLALVAIGDETTGFVPGANVIPFGSTAPQMSKNARYWIGFFADAGFEIQIYRGTSRIGGYQTVGGTYPNAPEEYSWATAAVYSQYETIIMDYTVEAPNYGMVQEDRPNEISYNMSDEVGAQDLFGTDASLPEDAVIYGVQLSGVFRKDDADSRYAANVIQSGATTKVGTSKSLTATYAMSTDVFDVNPDTSADWTPGEINAARIGYKVTS